MHTTKTSESIKSLKREAKDLKRMAKIATRAAPIVPAAQGEAQHFQECAEENLALAEKLKAQARLEDISLWVMEKFFVSKRHGTTKHEYWMASWREGKKVHNEYLGSCSKLSAEEALANAHKIKAEVLGLRCNASSY